MGEQTAISWTDATFNPWWGCSKVSPACEHCYAETWANLKGPKGLWSANGARRFFNQKHWDEPLLWNRKAAKEGKKLRVFCGSMCDVLEVNATVDLDNERTRLFNLIEMTPNLEWMLLTKRPENIPVTIPAHWLENPPDNVRLMVTAENQEMYDHRLDLLFRYWSGDNGISIEPMLGPIDLNWGTDILSFVDWVIVGGESGTNARPLHPDWVRSVRDQCKAEGVPFHFKQWGEWISGANMVQGVHPDTGIYAWPWIKDYPTDTTMVVRVGKQRAGHLLDGVEYLEFPK